MPTFSLVCPLFSMRGLLLWLALVLRGGVNAVMHWEALTSDLCYRASIVCVEASTLALDLLHDQQRSDARHSRCTLLLPSPDPALS
ncbi:hypothetical protein [Halomonas sp. H10-9-1]|uniref:hypothetical protein n=1 Tax=Halomonas sp. H10-9-1 TaxID=2950871 RepID=UPI0032DF64BE